HVSAAPMADIPYGVGALIARWRKVRL
ncbi:MAG: hypothetical protein ACJAVS_002005, partial [Paracoccaceae bacterium]